MNKTFSRCDIIGLSPILMAINYYGYNIYGKLSFGVFIVSVIVVILPMFIISELTPLRIGGAEAEGEAKSRPSSGNKKGLKLLTTGIGAAFVSYSVGNNFGGLALICTSFVGVFGLIYLARRMEGRG